MKYKFSYCEDLNPALLIQTANSHILKQHSDCVVLSALEYFRILFPINNFMLRYV